MSIGRAWAASLLVASTLGCASLDGRIGAAEAVPSLVAASLDAHAVPQRDLLAVAVSEGSVWAIDADDGRVVWERPVRPFGIPVAAATTVIVPERGRTLEALDLRTGASKWRAPMPGEAFTGLGADDQTTVVTALAEGKRHRSVIEAFATLDGTPRWRRKSKALLGVPAVVGGRVFVPHGGDVLVLDASTGRPLARLDPPVPLEISRIEHRGDMIFGADGNAFVDLYEGADTLYRAQALPVAAFVPIAGFAPGFRASDGLVFRLLTGTTPGAPRDAVFMARRVLMALRMDPDGRPIQARWIHLQIEAPEFVALRVDAAGISVMREDGAVLSFDPASGRRTAGFVTGRPVGAAIFVGEETQPQLPRTPKDRYRRARDQLLVLLDDPDPRLLPAQQLALDLLWRDPDPEVRRAVAEVASREGETWSELAAYAHGHLRSELWGRATLSSLQDLLAALGRTEPEAEESLAEHADEAVRAGGPAVIPLLVEHLLRAETTAADLEAIADALRRLDDDRAIPGVATFVARYHADPEIAAESSALFHALSLLASRARDDVVLRSMPEAQTLASGILEHVWTNEFTAPSVRAYLERFAGPE